MSVHDPTRGVVRHRVRAPDRQGVAAALGVDALQVLSVELVAAAADSPAAGWRLAGAGATFPRRLFSQELAVLLDSGIPMLEALQTLQEKETQAGVATTLAGVVDGLERGQPLSAALRAQGGAFDELMLAVVAASERTGQLAVALRQHAAYLAWVAALRARLAAAAVYPALLLLVGGAVVLFLLLYVLPRFAGILEGMGHDLPVGSLALLALGRFTGAHPGLLLYGAGGLAILALALARHAGLRASVQTWAWRAPWLGPRLRVLALARLYRTLAMLLGAGVPVTSAMAIARGVVALPLQPALAQAEARVSQGVRLSEALEQHGLCSPVARRMVRVGERSGQLASMLERAAAFHDEEAAQLTEFITRAVNPVLMLVIGGVIGNIVVLMYLPIFQLVEQVQ